MMFERQREGIAKAKGEGRYKGRVPTARNQSAEVLRLRAGGKTPAQVAKLLGMSRMSVYRMIQSGEATEQVAA
jgi:DNA invertase Pin-like site-specific DNA recombinase